ncbi:unnamed protein product [Adineta steineri]|uniref:Uncharacterized protein n=2 Tax=Adineta steineri TaxID=433720 RepID=A0A814K0G6_9BILA|nr:unnamed protein product [Adineta steineri]CAF3478718.1 unnamed protein product [Adineta steineri]
MKFYQVLFLICYSLINFLTLCYGSADVYTDGMYIKDDGDRIRIYHGTNFVNKGFPWYPPELLDPIFVANLSSWGLNFVRLGMMWEGVEPNPQQYNYTYLNIMKDIVKLLESNEIFVLFDMHQDVLSSRTGSYDGIPSWLYDKFPAPAHPYPWPFKKVGSDWFLGYLTEACSHGFQCLYDNVGGAVESMSNFWRLVATNFNSYSNLLGYELINEPWAGNYLTNPFLLLPGVAGSTNLQPLYDKISKSIRSVDNKTLIFYEPVTWGVRLNGKYMGSGFTHVPGGNDYRNRSVFSYHYYCTILQIQPVPDNETIPGFDRVLCDDIEGPALFDSTLIDVKQLGGSSFLTEFGGCDDSPTCDEQLNWAMKNADRFFQSWAYWGNVYNNMKNVKLITRPYARAIAGQPNMMNFDVESRLFSLTYYLDISIKKATEIYVPSLVYPKSTYNITVNQYIQWKVDPINTNIILVEPTQYYISKKEKNLLGIIQIAPTA